MEGKEQDSISHGIDCSKMSSEDFDRILGDILQEEGRNLLLIPGVYDAVAEHFSNDVLDRWVKEAPLE